MGDQKRFAHGQLAGLVSALGALALGLLLLTGCGPAPGYEPAPQTPSSLPPNVGEPTDDELALAQNANAANAANVPGEEDTPIGVSADEYADTDPSALTDFRSALEGHGEWVEDPTYGTVWVPAQSEVGADFEPYVTDGQWAYDDEAGWTWVSDYSWGWAPFHYGRWVRSDRYGWAWIPGRTYSGAWVVWRTGDSDYDYVGWSAAPPDWYWYNGVAVAWSFGWSPYYTYCSRGYLHNPRVGRYVLRGASAREMEARTRPYVPASSRVTPGGRGTANSRGGARGPTPGEMGINRASIPAPPRGNRGLERAHAFASPRTAQPLGGSPAGGRPRATARPRTSPSDRGTGDRMTGQRPNYGRNPAISSRVDPVARQGRLRDGRSAPSGPVPRSSSPSGPVPRASSPSSSPGPAQSPSFHPSSPPVHSSPSSSPGRSTSHSSGGGSRSSGGSRGSSHHR
ncbi:MAG: hypothetical protein FWD73_08060 [Polyangiaceae bacterium]|nr:hypothetical protein [Polyangiaceae bacterium]